jgi:hypothetical protein
MYGPKSTQKLVHLPGPPQPSRSPNQDLPQGECRFILRDADADGSRVRCDCVSFSLNHSLPGAQCGCGHQAWHHVKESTGTFVSMQEHQALVERCAMLEDLARRLGDDLAKEKIERERLMKEYQKATMHNMVQLRYYVDEKIHGLQLRIDDKLESVEDKAHAAIDAADALEHRFSDLDESVIRLEERADLGRRASRSMTPLLESGSTAIQSPPPERVPEIFPPLHESRHDSQVEEWDIKVILLPSRYLQFAPNPDSVVFKRCQTRGFVHELHLTTLTSSGFSKTIEAFYGSILRGRPWMPLQCFKSSDMSIGQLPPHQINPTFWDYNFLEGSCLAHDKAAGEILYIALQNEDLGWEEIKNLPSIFGSDESCWREDEKLDAQGDMDYRMESTPTVNDTDSTYEKYNSPPPYQPGTPRQGPITAGQSSPLDILAIASAGQPHASATLGAPSISERSNYSAPSIIGTMGTISSIESTLSGGSAYDEHRDKRTKRPTTTTASSSGTFPGPAVSAPNSPPPQAQIVYSGRTKRKVATNTKYREPMDWRPTKRFEGLLHRHDSKDKRPQTSGSQTSS